MAVDRQSPDRRHDRGLAQVQQSARLVEADHDRVGRVVADDLEDIGVRSSRIETIGYGKSHPRATNSTAAGRQLNRRVEIHVRANAA